MSGNPVELLFFGVLILVVVLFMFRNGRKRQRDQAALSQGLKLGAEVMTTFGVFGTIESFDEQENRVTLRTSPTSELTIHRQAIGKVVTPTVSADAEVDGQAVVLDDAATDPTFGERIEAEGTEPRRSDGAGTGPKAD